METNSSVAEKSGVVTGREPDADGAPAEQQRHLSPDARVHPDARVGNATIEAGAVIERDTEILSGSSVGRNSTVGENNIVMGHVGANTRIDPSSTILGNVGDGCKIGSHVTVPKGLAVPDGTTIPDDCEIVWGEGNKPEVSAKRGDWQATENGRPSGNGDGIADPDPYMRNTMRSWDTRDPKGPNEPMLVHPDAKIGAGSMACGGSTMEAETSIGMGVVVDNAHLTGKAKVEGRTWVEQGAVVRSTVGVSARIGANAVVDGPVGTGAQVGQGSIVRAGAQVPENGVLPANRVAETEATLPEGVATISRREDPTELVVDCIDDADIGDHEPTPPAGPEWIDKAELERTIEARQAERQAEAPKVPERQQVQAKGQTIEQATARRKQPGPGGDPAIPPPPERPVQPEPEPKQRSRGREGQGRNRQRGPQNL